MSTYETPIYSHAEQAVQRALSKPRGNYGQMISDGVYDGLSAYDKMVQDAMVKRIMEEVCSPIAIDVFKLIYDDTMSRRDFAHLIQRLLTGLVPPHVNQRFAMECLQRWSHRQICGWRILRVDERASTESIPPKTLYNQSSNLRKDLNDIKEAGLAVIRCRLQELGVME